MADKYYKCPNGNYVWSHPDMFGYELLSEKDVDGNPLVESGLFCFGCQKVHGLSKLELVADKTVNEKAKKSVVFNFLKS